MKRLKTTALCAIFTIGCAGDFSPVIADTASDEGPTDDDTDTSSTGDESTTDGETTEEDGGSTTGGETGDDTGETGEPPGNPGPNEPCDPLLAFEGDAPCEDPEGGDLTCAIVRLMPDVDTTTYEFRCLQGPSDGQGDGYDLGDNCSDYGGGQNGMLVSTGCLNSFCLWNGLGNDPDNDEPWGHPPGECPFVLPDEMGYSFGCCVEYCDDDHPCDPGWMCQMGAPAVSEIPEGYGACVWL